MRLCVSQSGRWWLAVGLAAAAAASMLAASAAPTAGPIIDLPAKTRQEIERYLGKGVVGRLGPFDHAKQAMRHWVKRFVERLDEAHGYSQ